MQREGSLVLEPLRIRSVTLPSRVVMGSMHTELESDAANFDALGRFYAARAAGGVGLIVTGGFAPNPEGRMKAAPGSFHSAEQVADHRRITGPVHAAGGRILLQILHAGRYGYHADIVAPTAIRAPINRETPREMTNDDILRTIEDYARTAALALEAGYDGVEVMGSEGYLISEFLASRTNHRTDDWGGSLDNRARFPLEVVRAVRRALGEDAVLSYRISALELVEGGLTQEETLWLAQQVEAAGADCLSVGIGWHEAPVPTIAGAVPHAGFAGAAKRLKEAVTIPVTASNRINLPEDAEAVLASGAADLVSMARPMLADPDFVAKMRAGQGDRITVCIACNQACLDHYFTNEPITCLVNPRAAREAEFTDDPAPVAKRVAVVGGGVAGIAAALEAARRGHAVTLYEAAAQVGGQFTLAGRIPGKEDYARAVDGFRAQLDAAGVAVRTGTRATAEAVLEGAPDEVVIASGITPRAFDIPGADDPRVIGYTQAVDGSALVGRRVAIIGGGGIGHDVALFLALGEGHDGSVAGFETRWGIYGPETPPAPAREITMLKRSPGPFGRTLGKTTGWILRKELKDMGVRQLADVRYLKIDAAGLHIAVGDEVQVIAADTIVVCAGQESENGLARALMAKGLSVHVVGGARLAGELDAKRAIREGALVGNRL